MNQTTWGVTLNYKEQERLEDRLANIVNYMAQQYPNAHWRILNIDATGKYLVNLNSFTARREINFTANSLSPLKGLAFLDLILVIFR